MTWMDRWIQRQRIDQAVRNIPSNSTILDIGCVQGELFQVMGNQARMGFVIDPLLIEALEKRPFTLIKGNFPDDWILETKMNCITMLAVLEHIPVRR